MEPASEITNPRIYVACLAAYNNGILHGAWIDASQEAWAIYDGIKAILDSSPITDAEEWAIHDYEGFEGIELCEYAGIEGVAEKAAFIAEHGRLGAELFTYYGSLTEARQALGDRYHGQFESVADFMQESTEGSMTIPECLQYYIDWQAMARDAELSGDLFTIQTAHNQVHVFVGG